ncbi:AraC family transcriptional regulator [Nocardioides guangzhouensis]|uniref:AraC family transcriptional regulator n=1 Tax=Nocardioides guangzhouensis TaxID=2497878 RepID=A0A4Q4ZCA8_9ACTN|nr:AraC family transcriptional regulator [Nocardioides guangzhouensis]RYP85637.1 AraC family transcriptional regulator [Nocardioides guangzhouensis]
MDPLTDLLDAPRARDAFLLRVTMAPPWAVEVRDRAPLTLVAVTAGTAWFVPEGGEPVQLEAGDLLLVRGPAPYLVADAPDRAPDAVIHPGQRCETPDGRSLDLPMWQGVRSWGNDGDGPDTLLIGTYETAGAVGGRLLAALPPYVVTRAAAWHSPLVRVLADEVHGTGIGQASLLDRLLDALVVAVVQHWADDEDGAPAWLRGTRDPVVAEALRLLQDRPADPWTVGALARATGVSRAALARRFTAETGEPPMGHLAAWRMSRAADLLDGEDWTVARIAREVGYDSPFTFSTAFKRHHGVAPTGWRRRERPA